MNANSWWVKIELNHVIHAGYIIDQHISSAIEANNLRSKLECTRSAYYLFIYSIVNCAIALRLDPAGIWCNLLHTERTRKKTYRKHESFWIWCISKSKQILCDCLLKPYPYLKRYLFSSFIRIIEFSRNRFCKQYPLLRLSTYFLLIFLHVTFVSCVLCCVSSVRRGRESSCTSASVSYKHNFVLCISFLLIKLERSKPNMHCTVRKR